MYHTWPADVVAALFDEDGDIQYTAWYLGYEYSGYFGESVDGIWDFVGEPVNQTWEFWAGDWASGDTGFINEWEITLYYLDAGGYCGVTFTEICYEVIEQVQVGDIDNDTGDFCGYYADYTSISTDMDVGVSYPITVNIVYADDGDRVGVWVDWNQDHDFDDADETISMSGSTSTGIYNGTITPPAGALTGPTRMRVRLQWNTGVGEEVPAEPCGSSEYGEVEDYTIVVVGAQPVPGDMDGDGDVDLLDVDELCEMWLTDDVTCDIYPEGGDGTVDMQDFAVQAENYGP